MNKNTVIAALATVIFIDEVVIAKINKRRMSRLARAYNAAEEKATYFATKLAEANVPLDEFDRIAINNFYQNV